MTTKQSGTIYRIIKASGHPELAEIFRMAMARSRKEVVQEVHNQTTPLFEHLIPLVALKKKNILYPTNWSSEINSYLLRIHAKNGSKGSKKRWLEAEDIEQILNEGLIPNLNLTVMKKLELEKYMKKPFPESIKRVVRDYLSDLLISNASLKKMNVSVKYEDSPILSVNGEKI
jgi:hypothetical protein